MTGPPSKRGRPDLPLDDWLGEEGVDDWIESPDDLAQTTISPAARPSAPRATDSGFPPDERDFREELIRRRRLIAIAAGAGVVLLAIVIPLVVFGGSGKKTPPVTVPTTPAATTPVTPPVKTPTTPTTPATPVNKVTVPAGGSLQSGDTGAEVKNLQLALSSLGFSPGKADGDFGPTTTAAVTKFQSENKLQADGIVGAATAAKINAALASG